MKRRDFIALIGSAATWPGLAFAQQTRTRKRVGFIADAPLPPVKRFRETLQKLGWVEGENLIIEFRYSGGKYDRYLGFAAAGGRAGRLGHARRICRQARHHHDSDFDCRGRRLFRIWPGRTPTSPDLPR